MTNTPVKCASIPQWIHTAHAKKTKALNGEEEAVSQTAANSRKLKLPNYKEIRIVVPEEGHLFKGILHRFQVSDTSSASESEPVSPGSSQVGARVSNSKSANTQYRENLLVNEQPEPLHLQELSESESEEEPVIVIN